MITIVTDRQWKGYKVSLAVASILAGAAIACLVMADKTARAEQRARDKCADTVFATDGTRADLERCFQPR